MHCAKSDLYSHALECIKDAVWHSHFNIDCINYLYSFKQSTCVNRNEFIWLLATHNLQGIKYTTVFSVNIKMLSCGKHAGSKQRGLSVHQHLQLATIELGQCSDCHAHYKAYFCCAVYKQYRAQWRG